MRLMQSFRSDERGVAAIQYAMVALICSMAIIAGLYAIRGSLNDQIGSAAQGVDTGH